MSGLYQFLIFFCVLFSSSVFAMDVFLDAVYWKATETVDWVLMNDMSLPNQNITYKTLDFNYEPGFRLGFGFEGEWDSKFFYSRYYTRATDSASGNLVSTFLGGKIVQGNTFFYHSGQAKLTVDFNMFDADLTKKIQINDSLIFYPVVGLRGGWINQKVITDFQGLVSITEKVKNNFRGIGPKLGIESKWTFARVNQYEFSLFSNFLTSYLWGHWLINDVTSNNTSNIHTRVGSRDFGAFTLEGIIGVHLDYKDFSAKLGYEIGDWFNQYQVLDDGTGAHNNDLILQGITLRVSCRF